MREKILVAIITVASAGGFGIYSISPEAKSPEPKKLEQVLCNSKGSINNYNIRYVKIFPEAHAYQGSSRLTSTGAVKGRVLFSGQKAPENKRKLITKDQEVCGSGYKIDRVYEISPNGGVKNAVVYVEGVNVGKVPEPLNVHLNQEKCEFNPRIITVVKGSSLTVMNKDTVTHEANGILNFATIFQLSQPKQNQKDTVVLKEPGIVEVSCNIHGWMKAWVLVLDNPYYALTSEDGSFSIEGLPTGRYKIKVWHEGLGEKATEIDVKENTVSEVIITYQK